MHAPPPTIDCAPPVTGPVRRLGLLDAASIIVGIIIGAGFLQSSASVARMAGSAEAAVAVWVAGAVVALVGAACYAELATLYPHAGGDYEYLTEAYGRPTGFLFAWTSLLIVRPANIGAMAIVFAKYAAELTPLPGLGTGLAAQLAWAIGCVTALTAVNAVGLRGGRWAQNLLTAAKLLGLAGLFAAALFAPSPDRAAVAPSTTAATDIGTAMVFVLFAYGGWENVTYVAGEIRDPRRNLWRALLLGTAAVAVVYVVGTAAFVRSLGFEGLASSGAVAADVLRRPLGDHAARAVSLLVCVACLGAINGMLLTGSRVFYAVGRDHGLFRWLSKWNGVRGVPLRSLLLQSALTVGLLAAFGSYADGFERMIIFSGPPFWFFFAMVGLTVFVFRVRRVSPTEAGTEKPFRVPLYPLTPAVFVASSLYLAYAGVRYAWTERTPEALWTIGALVAGVAMMAVVRGRKAGRALDEEHAGV